MLSYESTEKDGASLGRRQPNTEWSSIVSEVSRCMIGWAARPRRVDPPATAVSP